MKTWMLLIALSLLSFNANSQAKTVIWKKVPLEIYLGVGEERVIHFPADVEFWAPDALTGLLDKEMAAGVVYLTPSSTFEKHRVKVRELESGKIYLIDIVSGTEKASSKEVIVVDSDRLKSKSEQAALTSSIITEDWTVRLTRFASQRFYGPERLMISDSDIHPVPLAAGVEVNLIRGGKVKATTLRSWKGGSLYVTAFRLENTSNDVVYLDPRKDIRGGWKTAVFQHSSLFPVGDRAKVTTVYLTSSQPLREIM